MLCANVALMRAVLRQCARLKALSHEDGKHDMKMWYDQFPVLMRYLTQVRV
jgi:hypothetical protein